MTAALKMCCCYTGDSSVEGDGVSEVRFKGRFLKKRVSKHK